MNSCTARCVIYARYSPRPDSDDGARAANETALCRQLELCREHAATKGYEVLDEYADEHVSRNAIGKPGLISAVGALRKGDVLLCYDCSRFGGGEAAILDEIAIEKRGARIEFVSGGFEGDGPTGKLVRQILYAIAEHERAVKRARCSDRMKRLQSTGRKVGGKPPYGFSLDPDNPGVYVEVPHEIEAIRRARELREQHGWGHKKIASALGREGHTPRGKRWYGTAVSGMLEREYECLDV